MNNQGFQIPSKKDSILSLQTNYEEDGYVIIRNLLDAQILSEVQEHVDWLSRKFPDRNEIGDHKLVKNDPFWLKLAAYPPSLDVAQQFIGSDIALFASSYFTKKPFSGQPTLWHQDGVYWPLEPPKVISLWIAVDDSTPENGCLRVIPGTHKLDLKEFHENKDIPNSLESEIDLKYVDEPKAVNIVLNAGDVSIHHPNIIHGSKANTSSKRRCGLTMRYIPTSTRITVQPWDCQFLLRGNAVKGVNEYMPSPKFVEGVHMPFHGKEEWMN